MTPYELEKKFDKKLGKIEKRLCCLPSSNVTLVNREDEPDADPTIFNSIQYNNFGEIWFVDESGVVFSLTGGGGGNVLTRVDFSVNANPNTGGTTFNPNTPHLDTVLYVSTIDNSLWVWNGSSYVTYVAPFWTLVGNTVNGTDFIGSVNSQALRFRTNSLQRMVISATGNIGIANTSPSEKLDITGNLRLSGALMPNNLPGSTGNYLVSGGANNPPVWTVPGFWSTTGNAGTGGTGILGTTDNQPFSFYTNNLERARIDASGNVGVGTTTPSGDFHVSKNAATVIHITETTAVNGRVIFQVVSPTGFFDFRSYGSGYSADSFFGMNVAGSHVAIAHMAPSLTKALLFGTFYDNPVVFGTQNTERMRLLGNGNFGIGTTAPTQKFDLVGNLKFSGALMPNNTAGTSGYVLQSNGAGTAPTWVPPSGGTTINFAENETPAGTMNSSNTGFSLANTPIANSLKLYFRGLRLKNGSDFTLSGTSITMIVPPDSGDALLADYRY